MTLGATGQVMETILNNNAYQILMPCQIRSLVCCQSCIFEFLCMLWAVALFRASTKCLKSSA